MTKNFLIKSDIIQSPITLFQREQEFIEDFVMGPHFPWFWQDRQTFNDEKNLPEHVKKYVEFHNGPFLSHTLLHRTEDESVKHTERPPKDISTHFEFFMELFHRFMSGNNLKYKNIFRANLNLTWHCSNLHSAPHLDHTWPHKNFIMYLTNSEQGHTILWPDDFSTSYSIPCNQYTAVTFDQHWHAQKYPEINSRRVVLVITYI